MPKMQLDHFRRAAADIGAHGDNDTLPFDIDNRLIKQNADVLANIAFEYCRRLTQGNADSARKAISSLNVFSERLLAPTTTFGSVSSVLPWLSAVRQPADYPTDSKEHMAVADSAWLRFVTSECSRNIHGHHE